MKLPTNYEYKEMIDVNCDFYIAITETVYLCSRKWAQHENVTNYIQLIYMYKEDLVLNNLQ